MKIAIILCSALTLVSCAIMNMKTTSSSFSTGFVDIVKSYGYPVESYEVQTEDGYILNLFRIPCGKENNSEWVNRESASNTYKSDKKVVFLMHGFLSNCEAFVFGGPPYGLAFYLADLGYDVFLGNARGSWYGQRHTTLDPKRDATFWNFCWHEMGVKDLPALVDKALSVSGQNQLSYIGHNDGTTSFFVLTTEKSDYNNKFDRYIALGPVAFMKNSNSPVIADIESHLQSKPWLIKNLGISMFSPTSELLKTAKTRCLSEDVPEYMCKSVYFLVNGYNSKYINQTTAEQLASHLPSSASAKEILHFAWLKYSGRFQTYSEGSNSRDYDLSKVTVPGAIFYTSHDPLSNVKDVEELKSKLPHIYCEADMKLLTNNVDLLYCNKVNHIVYQLVQEALEENTENKV